MPIASFTLPPKVQCAEFCRGPTGTAFDIMSLQDSLTVDVILNSLLSTTGPLEPVAILTALQYERVGEKAQSFVGHAIKATQVAERTSIKYIGCRLKLYL